MHGRFSIFLAEIMCLLYTLATLSHTKNMPLALILPLMESLTLAMTLSLVGEKMRQIVGIYEVNIRALKRRNTNSYFIFLYEFFSLQY